MSEFANSQSTVENFSVKRRLRIAHKYLVLLCAGADWLAILLSGLISNFLYKFFWRADADIFNISMSIAAVGGIFFVFQANLLDLYRMPALLQADKYIRKIAISIISMYICLTFVLFILHIGSDVPRIFSLYFTLLTMIVVILSRLLIGSILKDLLERGAIVGRRAVLVGEEEELERQTATRLLVWFGLREVSRVLIATSCDPADPTPQERVAHAIHVARERGAEDLVVAIAWSNIELLEKVNTGLRASTLPVRLLPDRAITAMMGDWLASAHGPMVAIELQRAPLSALERRAKRILDVTLAIVALLLLSPIMALGALAVRLDSPGPILFRQQRTGFDGEKFRIRKFRTMTVLEDGAQVLQAKPGDGRITRVGAVLRRTSIDELPQLFNVLLGDMSLVGPRPHALAHDQEYQQLISKYAFRFHVKPGITGWAQVSGLRGETARLEDMERRIEFDLWYINNWSFGLDLWILLRTCFEVGKQKAY